MNHATRRLPQIRYNQEISNMICGMDVGVIANRLSVACELMLPVKLMEYIGLGIPVIVPRRKTIQYYFSEDMVSYFEPENIVKTKCKYVLK